jgi:DNA anti-recombination protein RmuC
MEELGGKLDAARSSYTKAFGQLYQGRGNLIKQAKDFERLGVAVKAALPQDLVDKAELELDLLQYTDQVATDFTEGDLAGEETANPEDRAA